VIGGVLTPHGYAKLTDEEVGTLALWLQRHAHIELATANARSISYWPNEGRPGGELTVECYSPSAPVTDDEVPTQSIVMQVPLAPPNIDKWEN
jgi:hypothetical protein